MQYAVNKRKQTNDTQIGLFSYTVLDHQQYQGNKGIIYLWFIKTVEWYRDNNLLLLQRDVACDISLGVLEGRMSYVVDGERKGIHTIIVVELSSMCSLDVEHECPLSLRTGGCLLIHISASSCFVGLTR